MSFHILAAILYPGVLWLPEQLTVQCMSVRDGIYLLSLNTCVYHLTHRSIGATLDRISLTLFVFLHKTQPQDCCENFEMEKKGKSKSS